MSDLANLTLEKVANYLSIAAAALVAGQIALPSLQNQDQKLLDDSQTKLDKETGEFLTGLDTELKEFQNALELKQQKKQTDAQREMIQTIVDKLKKKPIMQPAPLMVQQ